MNNPLKVAIVTGAGTGIGRAISLRLAKDGFYIVAAYANSESQAKETVQMIQNQGGEGSIFRVDISEEEQVNALFAYVSDSVKRLDVVVNNAGIGSMGMMSDITTEEYDRVFNTNSRGTFFMCRGAARLIADKGRIVNISTGLTVSSQLAMGLYAASKAAIEGFTKTLAHELGQRGITANTISPGMTDTPMLQGGDADYLKKIGAANSVTKRLGQPEDIASVVSMLVSEDGRWITGQNIHADGGSIIL